MKKLKDLTDQELMDLTDDDIQKYVDLECAEEGIPIILVPPTAPAILDDIKKDVEVFKIAGVCFTNLSDAEVVKTAIHSGDPQELNYDGYIVPYASSYHRENIEIKREMVYSEARYKMLQSLPSEARQLEKSFNDEVKSYNNAKQKRAVINQRIRAEIQSLLGTSDLLTNADAAFKRYMELFSNKNKAWDALVKAMPGIEDYKSRYIKQKSIEA